MIEYLAEDQVIHVPSGGLKMELEIHCTALVKEPSGYRTCRRRGEFWMPVPWGNAQVVVCFTHINAREVTLPL